MVLDDIKKALVLLFSADTIFQKIRQAKVSGISPQPLSTDDIMALLGQVTDPLHRVIGRTVELAAGR